MSTKKTCSRCKARLPLDAFPRNRTKHDGRATYCRSCKRLDDRRRARGYSGADAGAETAPIDGLNSCVHAVESPAIAARTWRSPRTKLNREVIDTVCAHIARGHTRRAAASMAGIHHSTLERWLASAGELTSGLERDLWSGVAIAEGIAEHGMVETIIAAQASDVHQARWHLERRFPSDWARRDTVAVQAEVKPFDADVIRELIEKRIAGLNATSDSPTDVAAE